ncbi:MAG TPA: hypothetical protein VFC72_04220 [Corynebacterium sp.]|nr:hypothetical protein [Corynebacterium sp.]
MKTIGQYLGGIIGVLILIGVIKGLGDSDLTGDGVGDIALSVINGVADLTIQLVPTTLDAISSFVG